MYGTRFYTILQTVVDCVAFFSSRVIYKTKKNSNDKQPFHSGEIDDFDKFVAWGLAKSQKCLETQREV